MEEDSLRSTLEIIHSQLRQIIEGQTTLGEVKEELDNYTPFEEDYLYGDHYEDGPTDPQTKEINGVEFVSRILHRKGIGLKDIKGADLLYEIDLKKYVLIQYKKADQSGRIKKDASQLSKILINCPVETTSLLPYGWPKRINGWCGSWLCLIKNGEYKFMQACQAKKTFGTQQSQKFEKFVGMNKSSFDKLFAGCQIGASVSMNDLLTFTSLVPNMDHILFIIHQRGLFN